MYQTKFDAIWYKYIYLIRPLITTTIPQWWGGVIQEWGGVAGVGTGWGCHLSFLKKLSGTHKHHLISICEFLKPYKLLFLKFESFVKGLNVNWKKNSLKNFIFYLSFLEKLSLIIHPCIFHLWIFETLWVIISWVWVIHKWLNANWGKNDSIILSVTCHGLGNFLRLIHMPSSICEVLKPIELLFLSLSHS